MNIGECVRRVDALRPNAISEEEKIRWAYELDAQLRHEFYPRYVQDGAGVSAAGTGEDAPVDEALAAVPDEPSREYVLTGSGPYEEMYVHYVASKVDLASQEMETYGVDNALFRSAMDDFRKDYNRTHVHL